MVASGSQQGHKQEAASHSAVLPVSNGATITGLSPSGKQAEQEQLRAGHHTERHAQAGEAAAAGAGGHHNGGSSVSTATDGTAPDSTAGAIATPPTGAGPESLNSTSTAAAEEVAVKRVVSAARKLLSEARGHIRALRTAARVLLSDASEPAQKW
jgi:hypothetical protein